jgi:hypothetical protein
MTNVIIARWRDASNLEIRLEVYEDENNPEVLLDYFSDLKYLYGHTIVADEGVYRMFSDGTRVELSLLAVQPKIEFERHAEQLELNNDGNEYTSLKRQGL